MRRTLRKTAILRTTVQVEGKNGYGTPRDGDDGESLPLDG